MATKRKHITVTLKTFLKLSSMNHRNRLTKIDLAKKLPFSLTFLEVHLLLGKKQGNNLPTFSKFITETTKSQGGNI